MVGFFWSTVLLWHGTFTVNSLAHVMGRRRYATTDTSRNSALIALWTGGEGWHNNHHHFQSSARNGFFWWEFDTTYYGLKVLSWFRIVRDLKTPSERVLAGSRVRDGQFDMGMFKAHWGRATAALAAARTHQPARSTSTTRRRRREQLEERIHASRATLESYVASSLHSAEELAKLSRRRQREPAGVHAGLTSPGRRSSLARASSSVTLSAKLSSDTRMPRARSSIDFSAVERPLPLSRSARFRTTSATW